MRKKRAVISAFYWAAGVIFLYITPASYLIETAITGLIELRRLEWDIKNKEILFLFVVPLEPKIY